MVKWWDRFWGALWSIGSAAIAYKTARWFGANASPADLGPLRYGLIGFAFLFGLLVGMGVLSLLTIALMVVFERLLALLGYPMHRPKPTMSSALVTYGRATKSEVAPDAAVSADTHPATGNTRA